MNLRTIYDEAEIESETEHGRLVSLHIDGEETLLYFEKATVPQLVTTTTSEGDSYVYDKHINTVGHLLVDLGFDEFDPIHIDLKDKTFLVKLSWEGDVNNQVPIISIIDLITDADVFDGNAEYI